MKSNFICFKFSKITFLIICIILILTSFFIMHFKKSYKKESNTIDLLNNSIEHNTMSIIEEHNKNKNEIKIKQKNKTRVMNKNLKGFEIIGKIEISKLKVEKYILNLTNTKSLKISVTKVCGPDINQLGNFCIAGHNYNKIFGKIKTLEKNDKILLTDIYGNTTIYQVYDVYKTSPKDISCLSQDTQSEKEVTLITCTAGATKRIIVKAIEVYD